MTKFIVLALSLIITTVSWGREQTRDHQSSDKREKTKDHRTKDGSKRDRRSDAPPSGRGGVTVTETKRKTCPKPDDKKLFSVAGKKVSLGVHSQHKNYEKCKECHAEGGDWDHAKKSCKK